MRYRILALLVAVFLGAISYSWAGDILITGNSHSRIYLINNGKKICLPCVRAQVVDYLRKEDKNLLLIDYGYLQAGSKGDVLKAAKAQQEERTRLYRRIVEKTLGYDVVWDISDPSKAFNPQRIEKGDLRVGVVFVDKAMTADPASYGEALKKIGEVDLLICALGADLPIEAGPKLMEVHKEIDLLLVPSKAYLFPGAQSWYSPLSDGRLIVCPPLDGIGGVKVSVEKGEKGVSFGTVEVISFLDPSAPLLKGLPECTCDADCLEGKCLGGKCRKEEARQKVTLTVIRPRACISCNEDEIYDWIKGFVPNLELKVVYADDPKGQEWVKKLGAEMLPVFILSEGIKNSPGFDNIEDMLVKTDLGYVIKPQVSGVSVYTSRSVIPKRVDVFIAGILDENAYQVLAQLKRLKDSPEMRDWRFRLHYLISFANGVWSSLFGPNDLAEVLRQLCVRKYHPDKYLDYLLCRYENRYAQDDFCEVRLGIDTDKVNACITNNGELGYLLVSSSKLTQELNITTPGLILFENNQVFIPSPDVLTPENFQKWSQGKE